MTRTKQIALLTGTLAAMFLLAVAAVFVLGRDASPDPAASADTTEPLDLGAVIATVDGAPVYMGEAQARIEGLTTLHGDLTSVLGEDWHDVILGSLVSDQVLRAEAKARGIEITDADIQSSVADVQGMLGEGQTLDAWLVDQKMSYAEFVRRIELQFIGSRVYLAVTEDTEVSGEEIRDYYREHRADYEGTDGHTSPLLEVRQSIRETLMKEKKDQAYAAWLELAKGEAEVVVVMDGWWKDLA